VLVLGLWLVAQFTFTPSARLVADVAPLQTVLVDSASLAKRARVADLQPAVLPQVPPPVFDETPPKVELKPPPEVALPKPKPVPALAPKAKTESAVEPKLPPKVPPKADAKAVPAEALRVPPTLVPRPDPAAARAARERLAAEAALEAQLAEENSRSSAIRSGAQDEWNFRVRERIESNWYRPASARRGLQCRVAVTLVPGGTVVSAVVEACNGDAAVRESLRAAVLKSSPLPLPKDMRLFERKLVLEFTPDE
jgi:colicin import membrane protein